MNGPSQMDMILVTMIGHDDDDNDDDDSGPRNFVEDDVCDERMMGRCMINTELGTSHGKCEVRTTGLTRRENLKTIIRENLY